VTVSTLWRTDPRCGEFEIILTDQSNIEDGRNHVQRRRRAIAEIMPEIIEVDDVGEDDSDLDEMSDLIDERDLYLVPDLILPSYTYNTYPSYVEVYEISKSHRIYTDLRRL
jgi:hypothetical protein